MMSGVARRTGWIMLAVAAGSLAVLAVDRVTPVEGGVGVLYVIVVVLSLRSRRREIVLATSALVSVLIWVGAAISPGVVANLAWAVVDRSAAMLAVWTAALLGAQRIRAESMLERALGRERLLLRELDHRVRNNLATLLTLIEAEAADRARSKQDLAGVLRERVRTIATVHRLLSKGKWSPIALRDLFVALGPEARREAIDLDGPVLYVPASQVMSLGMVTHELYMNSLKHGALGSPGGRVAVRWETDAAGTGVRVRWMERGGPPITHPPPSGFGTELMRGLVGHDLSGQIDLSFPYEGASHDLRFRLRDEPAVTGDPTLHASPAAGTPGRRLLAGGWRLFRHRRLRIPCPTAPGPWPGPTPALSAGILAGPGPVMGRHVWMAKPCRLGAPACH